MELSPSGAGILSATQEILYILRTPKFHFRVHSNPTAKLSSHSQPRLQRSPLSSGMSTELRTHIFLIFPLSEMLDFSRVIQLLDQKNFLRAEVGRALTYQYKCFVTRAWYVSASNMIYN
jgi:hypothetical protein